MTKSLSGRFWFQLLIFILLLGFSFYVIFDLAGSFFQHYPLAFDSFYYLQEFKNKGYYEKFSPFFLVFNLLSKTLSLSDLNTYYFAVIFNSAVFYSLFTISFYRKKYWYLTPAFGLIILISPNIKYLFLVFLKEGFSLAVFSLGFLLLRFGKRSGWLFIFGAGLFHAVGVLLGVLFLLTHKRLRPVIKIVFFLMTISVAFLFYQNKIFDALNNFSFDTVPYWLLNLIKADGTISVLKLETALVFLFSLFLFLVFTKKTAQDCLVFFLPVIFFLPVWKKGFDAFAVRFSNLGVVVFFLVLILNSAKIRPRYILLFFFFSVLIYFFPFKHPIVYGPGLKADFLIDNQEVLKKWIPKNSLVYAPHGAEFMVAYFLDRKSTSDFSQTTKENEYFLSKTQPAFLDCRNIKTLKNLNTSDCFWFGSIWYFWKAPKLRIESKTSSDLWYRQEISIDRALNFEFDENVYALGFSAASGFELQVGVDDKILSVSHESLTGGVYSSQVLFIPKTQKLTVFTPDPAKLTLYALKYKEEETKSLARNNIITRVLWGAVEDFRFDQNGKEIWPIEKSEMVKTVTIHHSAISNRVLTSYKISSKQMVRAIYLYHAVLKGWGDLGYHYLIDQDGVIYEGKAGGESVIGAHVLGFNPGNIGIVLLGNFNLEKPSEKAIHNLQYLLKTIKNKYRLDYSQSVLIKDRKYFVLSGHRDYDITDDCPGDYLYLDLPQLRKISD